jgi:ABC-type sugar transport system permease subunit
MSVRSLTAARTRESVAAYAFLSPNLVLLGLFVFVPLVGTVVISLQKTDGFGSGTFVGAGNYLRLVGDPLFWRSAANTVLFTLLVTPISMGLGLLAAVLLNSVLPARPALRSAVIALCTSRLMISSYSSRASDTSCTLAGIYVAWRILRQRRDLLAADDSEVTEETGHP